MDGRTPVSIEDYIAIQNLTSVVCGIYIWEWTRSFTYEWDFYTGKRPWKHAMWAYLICRYSVLGAIFNMLVVLNVETPFDCNVWVKLEIFLPYLGLLMASSLIVIRVLAIWNRHPIIVAVSAAGMMAQVALLIHGVVVAKDNWESGPALLQGCLKMNTVQANLPALAGTSIVDALLLLLMLIGLFLRGEARHFGLGGFLLKQGLIWLALATAAELPSVVILILNLNYVFNQLFLAPEVIILAIAATNMHRTLTDFSYVPKMSLSPLRASHGSGQAPVVNRSAVRGRVPMPNEPSFSGQPRPVEIEMHAL
ncbi:unnamed protein product [Peniophora sp. CBMAI 1063]|nr:unnamed protein product [Peniophora sp. CBMAI 1063]